MNEIDRKLLTQRLSEFAMIAMLSSAVIAPAIVFSSALPFFKVEQLLIPVFGFVYLWMVLVGIARPIRLNALFVAGFVYFLCTIISIWYGATVLGHPVVLRDFYELPKVWIPVIFFTFGYESRLSEESYRKLILAFSFPVVLICLYAWAQFANLGFTYKLNAFYSSGGHIDLALRYARRVYATMGNPNALGQLMDLCALLFLLAFLYRVGNRMVNLLVAFACVITLVMTGSRFGLVAAALGLLLVAILVSYAGRRELAKLGLLLAFLPVFVWVYQAVATSNRRTLERYETLRNPLEIDSLRERVDLLWKVEWRDFAESPVVGHGPAKSVFTLGYTDSEYMEVLRSQGLLGLVFFLGYYLVPLYLIVRSLRAYRARAKLISTQCSATIVCAQFGVIVGVLALFMNIPMSTFYNPFLQGFLWLWLGVSAQAAKALRFSTGTVTADFGRAKHYVDRGLLGAHANAPKEAL
jgi:O-antigen ligase